MKKIIFRIILGVAVLLVVAALAAVFFLDSIVKRGIETIGPKVAKVEMKLDGVSISAWSGKGSLKGLFIGNPTEFKAPSAVKAGEVGVAIEPRSVLSDKILVRSISVVAPEITFEGTLRGNNLSKILDNIQSSTASEKGGKSSGKKLQVDELTISGGKINLSVMLVDAKSAVLQLPEIHLQNLGSGADGITAGELTEKIFKIVLDETTKIVAGRLAGLGKGVMGAAQDAGQGVMTNLEKNTKGIGDLFRKK